MRLDFAKATDFFKKLHSQFVNLQTNILNSTPASIEELLAVLKTFVESKPCSLVHLIYEKSIIADNSAPG